MITERIVASACFSMGGLLYLSGSGQEAETAYVFPNLLAIVMAVLGGIMMITADIDPKTKKSAAVATVPWIRLWPAFVVFLLYMAVAEQMGFFISSFLAFVLLGSLYSQNPCMPFVTNRCLPVGVMFLSALYGLFVLLLKVQLPQGVLF